MGGASKKLFITLFQLLRFLEPAIIYSVLLTFRAPKITRIPFAQARSAQLVREDCAYHTLDVEVDFCQVDINCNGHKTFSMVAQTRKDIFLVCHW